MKILLLSLGLSMYFIFSYLVQKKKTYLAWLLAVVYAYTLGILDGKGSL